MIKKNEYYMWNDPDNATCSQKVLVIDFNRGHHRADIDILADDIVIVQSQEGDEFEVLQSELSRIPKPNEIWKTNSDRLVLIVEHSAIEIEIDNHNNLGFIWCDTVDKTLNFTSLKSQLKEPTNMTIAEWALIMGELTK